MARPETALDGAAVAGVLSEIYAFDVTRAVVRCAACGHTDVVARTVAYLTAMGGVVRCGVCEHVLLVVVERPGGVHASAAGAAWMRV